MADIKELTVGGTTYKIKDEVCRTNILYALQTGVKNLLTITSANETAGNLTFTHNDDGSVLVNTGSSGSHPNVFHILHADKIYLKAGTYVFSGCPSGGSGSSYELRLLNNSTGTFVECKGTPVEFTLSSDDYIEKVLIRIDATYNPSNMTFYPMICAKSVYDQDSSFMVGALPNYDLTYFEAQDRAALAEEIDAGAKNKVNIADVTTTGSSFVLDHVAISLSAGSYVFSYTSNQSTSGDIQLIIRNGTTALADVTVTSKSGRIEIPFTLASAANNITLYSVRAGTYSDFMICTKAAFGVSKAFVPYRPNYDLVYDSIVWNEINLSSSADLDTLFDKNTLWVSLSSAVSSTIVHTPWTRGGFCVHNEAITSRGGIKSGAGGLFYQCLIPNNGDTILMFRRKYDGSSGWGPWYKFDGGTQVN